MAVATFVAAPRLLNTIPSKGGPLFAAATRRRRAPGAARGRNLSRRRRHAGLERPADRRKRLAACRSGRPWLRHLRHRHDRRPPDGDAAVKRVGDGWMLAVGGIVAVAGFVLLLASPWVIPALAGFALIASGRPMWCRCISAVPARSSRCRRRWPSPPSRRWATPACFLARP